MSFRSARDSFSLREGQASPTERTLEKSWHGLVLGDAVG